MRLNNDPKQMTPSTLDQIRQTEAASARCVAAARAAASEAIAAAETRIEQLRQEGLSKAEREAQHQHQAIIDCAQVEADARLVQARHQAENLKHRAEMHMDEAVQYAVALVVGE